jgi:transcriptional regulator with XRE-family HTH domain
MYRAPDTGILGNMDRRTELGQFLRTRREALRPQDVGLGESGRRRVPGLRRDEVALLANMSSNYYERLEQARGPRPSPALLSGIARALRLTVDERDYLYVLAGQNLPADFTSDGYVDPGLMHVLDALAACTPALVTDDLGTIVAQNPLNIALLGQFVGQPGHADNMLWRWFTEPDWRSLFLESQQEDLARGYVADLRSAMARRGKDPVSVTLVDDLLKASPEFASMWDEHDVAVFRSTLKVLVHAQVGRLDLQCDVVISPPTGQRLVLFRPQPGTDAGDRLDMLRVLGTQTFA